MNSKLPDFLVKICENGIQGKIDSFNEIYLIMRLLKLVLNSKKHTEQLINKEFLKNLFERGFAF